jgi:hypothetical protein
MITFCVSAVSLMALRVGQDVPVQGRCAGVKQVSCRPAPKHGSWLNPAEIEVSLWSRECAGRDLIATLCELQHRTHLWNEAADRARRKINWRFNTAEARRVFRYRAGTTPGPKRPGWK